MLHRKGWVIEQTQQLRLTKKNEALNISALRLSAVNLGLRENLVDLFHKEVDLVCLNSASPIIGMQVLKYGKCVLGMDQKLLHIYQMTLFTDYCDLKKLRQPMEEDISNRKFYG
jgi:hypothetical protein